MRLGDRPTIKSKKDKVPKYNSFFLKITNFKLIETKPLRITSAHYEG